MDLSQSSKRQIDRSVLWDVVQYGQGKAGTAYNVLLIALIIFSAALVALEFLSDSPVTTKRLRIMEAVVIALFTLDYGLRVYCAPNRRRYIFSRQGIVDLFSVIPFYAGIWGSPLIRLLSLVRLLKLGDIEGAAGKTDRPTLQKSVQLLDEERVEYVVSKSPIYLFVGVITPLVALIFGMGLLLIGTGPAAVALGVALLLFSCIFLWKTWLDYSYDVIYVTNYRLIFQNQHLFGRSINQVNYAAITNVKPRYPNPLSFILRYGTLTIDTAAEHPGQIQLHTVRRHEQAAHVIMQKSFLAQQRGGPGPLTT